MYRAFPDSDYYGPSAPGRGHQLTVRLPSTVLDGRGEGRLRPGSHVHYVSVGRIGAQLCRYSLVITETAVLQ